MLDGQMPRTPRFAPADLVHHVTHRGNRRGSVFFDDEDRNDYLRWLAKAADRYGLEVWDYCLMTNHVHLLVRSPTAAALGRAIGVVHGRYAQRINRRQNWSGHLWANRFFSHPIEGAALPVAARYIERNPVRAKMVERAEDYPWSSARTHCGLAGPGILSPGRPFPDCVADWSAWLRQSDEPAEARLRDSSHASLPLGSEAFCKQVGQELGRDLILRPRGRPRLDKT